MRPSHVRAGSSWPVGGAAGRRCSRRTRRPRPLPLALERREAYPGVEQPQLNGAQVAGGAAQQPSRSHGLACPDPGPGESARGHHRRTARSDEATRHGRGRVGVGECAGDRAEPEPQRRHGKAHDVAPVRHQRVHPGRGGLQLPQQCGDGLRRRLVQARQAAPEADVEGPLRRGAEEVQLGDDGVGERVPGVKAGRPLGGRGGGVECGHGGSPCERNALTPVRLAII